MEKVGKAVLDYFKRADKFLWLIMLGISVYSLLILRTVPNNDGGRSYFVTQMMAMAVGYAGAWFLTLFDYRDIANLWYLIAGVSILLIIYTAVKGEAVQNTGGINAKAWITIPLLGSFQPSELIKIGFIVTFSKHLSVLKKRELINKPWHVALLGVHTLIPVFCMFKLQGDAGSAAIFFFMFLAMAFGAGVQIRYFILLFVLVGVALPIVWQSDKILAAYQKKRLMEFMDLTDDPLGADHQQIQGRLSIGSGQTWGRGYNDPSVRVRRSVVPVQQSDMVLSVIGEQLGFIGCMLVFGLLLLLLFRVLFVSYKSPDVLGKSICYGFFGMIASQMIFNIGMCLDLAPVMGVTLPFFSSGGSSAACLYFGFGLVQCVAMHRFNPDVVKVNGVVREKIHVT